MHRSRSQRSSLHMQVLDHLITDTIHENKFKNSYVGYNNTAKVKTE